MRCDAQRTSRNPGSAAAWYGRRLAAPGRNVRHVCANGGVTTTNPEWSWPPWLLDPISRTHNDLRFAVDAPSGGVIDAGCFRVR